MLKRILLSGLFAGTLTLLNSCSTSPVPPPPLPSTPAIELKDLKEMTPAKLIDTIYSVAEKRFVSFDEMMAQAIKSPIIYVGETHDNVIHHQIQEKVLRTVYEKNGQTRKIALGMEMFQRPYQSVLDDYLAGKISEPEMLRQTEYYTRWVFDWSMYQPLVSFAKNQGLKVVALNAPREITKKVTKSGLASLTDEERKLLPEKINTADKNHRDYVYERFKPHIKMGMFTEEAFDKFYESQCLWEDTMADSAAGYFKNTPNGQEVGVVGGGHTLYRFGIPERAKWRTQMNYTSIMCVETGPGGVMELLDGGPSRDPAAGNNNNPADYLYFTKILKIDEIRPLMGVQLAEPKAEQKGLTIMEVVAGGPAAEAELMKDDIIIMVDNQPIKDMVDLKCALANKKAGDKVEIVVQRGQETKQVTLVLEIPKKTE